MLHYNIKRGVTMKHLKELRIQRKLTQKEVADFLQISRSAYTNYETDKREPDRETLLKLSEYFDVSVDYLMDSERKGSTINFNLKKFEDSLFTGLPLSKTVVEDFEREIEKAAIEDGLNNNQEIVAKFNSDNEPISSKILDIYEKSSKTKSPSIDGLASDEMAILCIYKMIPADKRLDLIRQLIDYVPENLHNELASYVLEAIKTRK